MIIPSLLTLFVDWTLLNSLGVSVASLNKRTGDFHSYRTFLEMATDPWDLSNLVGKGEVFSLLVPLTI